MFHGANVFQVVQDLEAIGAASAEARARRILSVSIVFAVVL